MKLRERQVSFLCIYLDSLRLNSLSGPEDDVGLKVIEVEAATVEV